MTASIYFQELLCLKMVWEIRRPSVALGPGACQGATEDHSPPQGAAVRSTQHQLLYLQMAAKLQGTPAGQAACTRHLLGRAPSSQPALSDVSWGEGMELFSCFAFKQSIQQRRQGQNLIRTVHELG